MAALEELGVPVRISKRPNELPQAIAFDEDRAHRAYDPQYAQRFWRVLVQADLAVSRFSGRTAPEHPGGIPNMPDRLVREAYSHECSSGGFWAGGEPGFKDALPGYDSALGEYVLPYLQTTYEAAANLGRWDGNGLDVH